MTHRTILLALSLLLILCYSTSPAASQSQVLTDSWSAWTCTSSTEASRSRIAANCTTMDVFDPLTNMTNIITSCANSTDTETMTDVVSVSLSWSMWSPVLPSCGTTRMISQSRAIQCSMVNPECSVTCNPREATRTEDIPLCCSALPWNEWTTWTTTSSSVMQTRQRTRDRTSCVNVGDCEDNCNNGTESRTVSTGPWSAWTCTSITEASRSRIVANCMTVEVLDPVTNMTSITTSCDNSTDMETTTNVVSVSLGWSMWSPLVPLCGTTRMISQSRAIQCSMVNPECSVICNPREATRTVEDIPLCCTALPWNQWTTWTSTACSSVSALQTRQRTRDRTSCVNVGDCEDSCVEETDTRTVFPTTWSDWETWSPLEEQMCTSGQRSRQRTCPSDSVRYCKFECSLGDIETETDCCEVRNQWSVWGPWSEPSTTGCPATRIKTRTCLVNTNVDTRNVTQTYPCSGLCTLDSMDSEEQLIIIERCTGSNTGTSSNDGSTGAAVGGAIGGGLFVIFIAMVVMLIVILFYIKKSQKKSSYPVYELPNSTSYGNANPNKQSYR
ncbi:A disintegrin and metalloproteinase with thrombospondin motifs adt-1-like [Dysidea avara]|uniref:A disintegrin and metalloproteinase with thrombospondin motifs adt-1-like n=1 Tax=Dysidea avara TaxID=196820 RepID=UPI00331D9905